jgi:phosphoribosyl 1,2-cyclic phosphodiesterase
MRMALYISSINSGSNANCYYVGNEHDAVLIDAGLSCRETEKRMLRLNLPMSRVRAIIVSHEHSDHISGVPGLSKKFKIPVFFSNATFRNSRLPIEDSLLNFFSETNEFQIASLRIIPFLKSHDAIDPHSFVVTDGSVRIGVFTDIGNACQKIKQYFSQCNAVFLESNYCETMLANGRYPYHLKRRISGDKGHLSNDQALELFQAHRGQTLSHLILSHLSNNNNHPDVVAKLFNDHMNGVFLHVASRFQESPIFKVEATTITLSTPKPVKFKATTQLSLF